MRRTTDSRSLSLSDPKYPTLTPETLNIRSLPPPPQGWDYRRALSTRDRTQCFICGRQDSINRARSAARASWLSNVNVTTVHRAYCGNTDGWELAQRPGHLVTCGRVWETAFPSGTCVGLGNFKNHWGRLYRDHFIGVENKQQTSK